MQVIIEYIYWVCKALWPIIRMLKAELCMSQSYGKGVLPKIIQFSSVQSLSPVRLFATPWTAGCYFPRPSASPRVGSDSCPLSWWCHPTVSSSVTLFSCLQSFPASGSFPMSWLFASGGRSIGASASASVLPMNTQDWFPLGSTGLNFLLSKGVFSSTTIWKHQSFSDQPSLRSYSPIHMLLLENP